MNNAQPSSSKVKHNGDSSYNPERRYESILLMHKTNSDVFDPIHVSLDSLWKASSALPRGHSKRISKGMAQALTDHTFHERVQVPKQTKCLKRYDWGSLLGNAPKDITQKFLVMFPDCIAPRCPPNVECNPSATLAPAPSLEHENKHKKQRLESTSNEKVITKTTTEKAIQIEKHLGPSCNSSEFKQKHSTTATENHEDRSKQMSTSQQQFIYEIPTSRACASQVKNLANQHPHFGLANDTHHRMQHSNSPNSQVCSLNSSAPINAPQSSWDQYRTGPASDNLAETPVLNPYARRPCPPPYLRQPVIPARPSFNQVPQASNPFQTAREFAETGPQESEEEDPYYRNTNVSLPYPSSMPESRQVVNDPGRSIQAVGGPVISAGLKRKFQPPKRINNGSANNKKTNVGATGGMSMRPRPPDSKAPPADEDDEELPEALQHLDKELVKKIQSEILETGDPITFEDIAGLEGAKQTIQELICWPMKRPDLFTGLRRAPNGLLLFGPPGTGKTLIGKAIAHESGATFFSISSSSLTSKWIGEGEKLVRTLFAVANYEEPAVVFIDEIDSLLTQRKSDENEASRRIKTEFLVQLDGTSGQSSKGRVLVIGATNRPHELDDAARRRFVKRLYIPLPEQGDRRVLICRLLQKNNHALTDQDLDKLSVDTHGFSGADLASLCTDAALGPLRQLGAKAMTIAASEVPPINYKHFKKALRNTKPSVAQSDLSVYLEWNATYGSKGLMDQEEEEDDSDEEHA